MNGLPQMVASSGIKKTGQVQFKGYNHNLYAQDGEIWDMENMTGDFFPLMSPRPPRYLYESIAVPNGFYAKDGMYWVDGTGFYADGVQKGTVENSRKDFVSLGAYIIILPDMKYYNTLEDAFGDLNETWTGSATIQNGTYAGEEAEANTIYAAGVTWPFKVGDAVSISGATKHPDNNQTIIIREIDGDKLIFYENSFVIDEGGDTEHLTISRELPEMDFMCENENRLWGCKGDAIYASKLGDPFNWNVFDGISTDSYAVTVGSAGDFTACFSYLGYPIFFKEEIIYKVYGDKPSNFQVMSSASLGVEKGSHRSLAIAGETLFYLSRVGIVAYNGGIPQQISDAFGTDRFKNGVGGSDGVKYYVSMDGPEGFELFVYDTRRGMWFREDDKEIINFGWNSELYFLDSSGDLWLNGNAREIPDGLISDGPVESMVEFGDFVEGDPNKKGISKIQIRMELDAGAQVKIQIHYDSAGDWQDVSTLTATAKRSFYLPVIPRRADHLKLKFIGMGDWKLYSLVREVYSGSALKSLPGRQ